MPMSFPTMESLKRAAEVHKFRQPNIGEEESDYRSALANHVTPIDFVESQEIRTGKGWDKFDEGDRADLLIRSFLRNR